MPTRILKKFLPPEEKLFYSFFEENVSIACECARLFQESIHQGIQEEHLQRARQLKARDREVITKTLQKLSLTFVTPLDREDIQNLTILIGKISKKIIKAIKHSKAYNMTSFPQELEELSDLLVKACDELKFSVVKLQHKGGVKDFTESNLRMKEIEEKEDQLLHAAWTHLFSGKYDALTVLKIRELYQNLERASASCFNVSDIVLNITLKHS